MIARPQRAAVGLRDRIGVHELVAQARDAERHARGPHEPARVADHHLEAAAAEVEADRGRGIEHDRGADRAEDQPRLLEPADDVDDDAGLVFDAVDELAAVLGPPDRARRAGVDLVGARGVGEQPEPPDRRHRLVGRGRRDRPVRAHDVAQAQHLLLLDDRVDVAVGLGVGDEEVEGVGAEVHRCDAHPFRLRPVTVRTAYRRRRARRDDSATDPARDFRAMGTDVTVLALAGARCRGGDDLGAVAAARDRGARGEVEPLPAHERALPVERRGRRPGGGVAGDVRARRRGPSTPGGSPAVATTRRSCPRCSPPVTTAASTSSRRDADRASRPNRHPRPDAPGSCSTRSCTRSACPAGVALDLGGIGKGYAADLVARDLLRDSDVGGACS